MEMLKNHSETRLNALTIIGNLVQNCQSLTDVEALLNQNIYEIIQKNISDYPGNEIYEQMALKFLETVFERFPRQRQYYFENYLE